MSEANAADAGSAGLPQVRLIQRDDETLVVPVRSYAGGDPPEPFRLPKVPKVLTDALALFCDSIHVRHQRCVAVLLLLEPGSREWNFRVPAQRCARTASCWSVLRRDVPELPPDALLAGSYQSRILEPGEAPEDAVPPSPGVHFVHSIHADHQGIWCFLRYEDRTERVPAPVVVFDDMAAWLAECMPG
jgi:hypothetical protein